MKRKIIVLSGKIIKLGNKNLFLYLNCYFLSIIEFWFSYEVIFCSFCSIIHRYAHISITFSFKLDYFFFYIFKIHDFYVTKSMMSLRTMYFSVFSISKIKLCLKFIIEDWTPLSQYKEDNMYLGYIPNKYVLRRMIVLFLMGEWMASRRISQIITTGAFHTNTLFKLKLFTYLYQNWDKSNIVKFELMIQTVKLSNNEIRLKKSNEVFVFLV